MNIPSSAGTTGYAAFFALRDAAAQRMEVSGARTAASMGADPVSGPANISLTKPARAVDPLQAASSTRVPLKGGRIDCLA